MTCYMCTGLSLDWTDKNIYWTSGTSSGSIKVYSQQSNTDGTLVSSQINPKDIVVLPLDRYNEQITSLNSLKAYNIWHKVLFKDHLTHYFESRTLVICINQIDFIISILCKKKQRPFGLKSIIKLFLVDKKNTKWGIKLKANQYLK